MPREELQDGTAQSDARIERSITFDTSAAEFVVGAFGWDVADSGYIVNEDGTVLSPRGETVRADHLAGIVMYEGEPKPIPDDITDLVEFVIDNEGVNDS